MDLATTAAVSGLRAGVSRLNAAAHSIANANTTDADGQPVEGRRVVAREGEPGVRATEEGTGQANEVVGPMVDSLIAKQEVAANAAVIRTAHETYEEIVGLVR